MKIFKIITLRPSAVFPHRTQRGSPEMIFQKLTWHIDEWFCWKYDHQIHILNQLSASRSDGGWIIPSMNTDLILKECKCALQLVWGRQEENDFRGSVLAKSDTVSRRIKAVGSARRTFFYSLLQPASFSKSSHRSVLPAGWILKKRVLSPKSLPGNLTSAF